jgi:hypothetical protein
MPGFDLASLQPLREQLYRHPVYQAVDSLPRLRCFMEHHIYSVWDFQSLIKSVQAVVAPVTVPWMPPEDASLRRFINELVMEEESDEMPGPDASAGYISHFDLYQMAMREVGADPSGMDRFLARVREVGVAEALQAEWVPEPSRCFIRTSFDFIASGKPHAVMAAVAVGREHIIPEMFRALLRNMKVSEQQASAFHYYLRRHIHLDEDFHAPMSLRLLDRLCADDPQRIAEAHASARAAISARIAFWDGVLAALSGIEMNTKRAA